MMNIQANMNNSKTQNISKPNVQLVYCIASNQKMDWIMLQTQEESWKRVTKFNAQC